MCTTHLCVLICLHPSTNTKATAMTSCCLTYLVRLKEHLSSQLRQLHALVSLSVPWISYRLTDYEERCLLLYHA